MAVCSSQFFTRRILKHLNHDRSKKHDPYDISLCYLNDEFMADLVSLLTGHLPLSHSLRWVCAWSAVTLLSGNTFLKTNISQCSVATSFRCGEICNARFIANFLLSVSAKEF